MASKQVKQVINLFIYIYGVCTFQQRHKFFKWSPKGKSHRISKIVNCNPYFAISQSEDLCKPSTKKTDDTISFFVKACFNCQYTNPKFYIGRNFHIINYPTNDNKKIPCFISIFTEVILLQILKLRKPRCSINSVSALWFHFFYQKGSCSFTKI